MIVAVADTHAAVWHLFNDKRLSNAASAFINAAAIARQKIGISSISLAEIVYLVEKQRLPANTYTLLRSELANPEHVFMEIPVTNAVVDSMMHIPRDVVPDLPDRIVAATASHFDVPLISCDSCIHNSNLQLIW